MADDPPVSGDSPTVSQEVDEVVDSLEFVGPPRLLGNLGRADILADHNRDLTAGDLQALNGPRGSAMPQSIQKIRSSHHALARCLASGMKSVQAAAVTGYTQNRISLLQGDPTFQALLADYRAEAKDIFADLTERMSNLSLDAIEELHERLIDAPETFSIPLLLDVVKTTADRTGHGPGQEVKLTVSPSMIDRPPKETYEEFQARRARELGQTDDPDTLASMEPPTGATN